MEWMHLSQNNTHCTGCVTSGNTVFFFRASKDLGIQRFKFFLSFILKHLQSCIAHLEQISLPMWVGRYRLHLSMEALSFSAFCFNIEWIYFPFQPTISFLRKTSWGTITSRRPARSSCTAQHPQYWPAQHHPPPQYHWAAQYHRHRHAQCHWAAQYHHREAFPEWSHVRRPLQTPVYWPFSSDTIYDQQAPASWT